MLLASTRGGAGGAATNTGFVGDLGIRFGRLGNVGGARFSVLRAGGLVLAAGAEGRCDTELRGGGTGGGRFGFPEVSDGRFDFAEVCGAVSRRNVLKPTDVPSPAQSMSKTKLGSHLTRSGMKYGA